MDIRVRIAEGDDRQPLLLWDTVWKPELGGADWVLAGPSEVGNAYGLQARHALHTAVVIQLFTWRRAEDYDLTPADTADRKGWWGDTIDLDDGETKLGSRLWLLFRSKLDESVRRKAIDYANEALQVLIDQGAAARIDVEAEIAQVQGVLKLTVRLFSQDGQKVYDQKFDIVWRQEFR